MYNLIYHATPTRQDVESNYLYGVISKSAL